MNEALTEALTRWDTVYSGGPINPDQDGYTCDDLGAIAHEHDTDPHALRDAVFAARGTTDDTPAILLTRDDYRAAIFECPDGTVWLTWTDYVTNDWTESHTSLAVALVRLATLETCRAADWAAYLALTPTQHADAAATFLAEATHGPADRYEPEPCSDCGRARRYDWALDRWEHEAPFCWLADMQGDAAIPDPK